MPDERKEVQKTAFLERRLDRRRPFPFAESLFLNMRMGNVGIRFRGARLFRDDFIGSFMPNPFPVEGDPKRAELNIL